MGDLWPSTEKRAFVTDRPPMRAAPRLVLVVAVFTTLISAAVCVAAILAPAPLAAVPLVVAISIGAPVFATWNVPVALACVRAERSGGRALASLRQTLARLPETEHPLGF